MLPASGISIATVQLSATNACCAGIQFEKDKSKVALKYNYHTPKRYY